MGAAKYVGRVGGLAVALGVGVAILTGQGVAYADDTGTASSETTATENSSAEGPARQGAASDSDVGTGADDEASDVGTAEDDEASDVGTVADDGASDVETAEDDEASDVEEQQSGGGTGEDSTTPAEPVDTADDTVSLSAPVVSTTVVSPPASADLALDPIADDSGTAPIGGSAADLLLLAGTRRELQAQQEAALEIPPYSVGVTAGVIGGCVVGPTCTTADGSTFTLIKDPDKGGKLALDPTTGAFRFLPFASEKNPDGSQNADGPSGQETFSVLVAQNTQFTTFLIGLPIVGSSILAPVIMTLQQIPVISTVLAPLIGTATRQDILVDIDFLRTPAETPVAYTTMVTSWDGTQISTNFFPAIADGNPDDGNPGYETILYGPGLAQAGATDPENPFVSTFRLGGYNVVTWDPRGEFASGGVLQLDSPQYEGQDVSQLISWAAGLDGVELDGVGDPTLGMVGVSYGGGIQFVTAAGDNRVDAIAPGWAWNTLPDSLYPDRSFKTAYSSLLLLGLVTTGARINPQIYGGIITGAILGVLTPGQIQLLQTSGPGQTVRGISAPTLIIQGTVDVLFPLQQSIVNEGLLALNEDVKMLWFCGGHGSCLPGQGNGEADSAWVMRETLAWMYRYVKDDGSQDDVVFEWTDQYGDRWTSEVSPTEAGFYDPPGVIPTTVWDTGKVLPIIPLIGGSGPNPEVPLPYSLGDGSIASNAVTIALENPVAEANVVGSPSVVIHYSGFGTSRHIYAQVVDRSTGLVVGNIVTPVPVTLNGRDQVVTVDLNDIAYTVGPDSELELQIFTTATSYFNATQFGFINVESVEVTMPTTTKGTNQGPNPSLPEMPEVLVAV
jgi:ABC-2 type transport system ATP-binding protein